MTTCPWTGARFYLINIQKLANKAAVCLFYLWEHDTKIHHDKMSTSISAEFHTTEMQISRWKPNMRQLMQGKEFPKTIQNMQYFVLADFGDTFKAFKCSLNKQKQETSMKVRIQFWKHSFLYINALNTRAPMHMHVDRKESLLKIPHLLFLRPQLHTQLKHSESQGI